MFKVIRSKEVKSIDMDIVHLYISDKYAGFAWYNHSEEECNVEFLENIPKDCRDILEEKAEELVL